MPGARSKNKGGNHEREINRKFSLWLSRGERTDLFTRNVLSGGAFTSSARRGKPSGMPGDAAAAHPLAYEFLELFVLEYKHWKNIQADAILWMGQGELLRVIDRTEEQARDLGRSFMIVARQDRRPDILFLPLPVAAFCCDRKSMVHHVLWSGRILACRLDELTKTDPDEFRGRAKKLLGKTR